MLWTVLLALLACLAAAAYWMLLKKEGRIGAPSRVVPVAVHEALVPVAQGQRREAVIMGAGMAVLRWFDADGLWQRGDCRARHLMPLRSDRARLML